MEAELHNIDREILLTKILILVTLMTSILFSVDILQVVVRAFWSHNLLQLAEYLLILFFIYFLIYGNLIYQFARIGYLRRLWEHQERGKDTQAGYGSNKNPSLKILVPSYKENIKIIRQTLLSAALQTYSHKKVVLLIDDPPFPKSEKDLDLLTKARALPRDLEMIFHSQAEKFEFLANNFYQRMEQGKLNPQEEINNLINLYSEMIAFYQGLMGDDLDMENHTDRFFIQQIIWEPIKLYEEKILRFKNFSHQNNNLPFDQVGLEYQKIAALFRVKIESFERKKYANLSHEANKAANLNSYIGLMGMHLGLVMDKEDLFLVKATSQTAQFRIDDADYVITLDADSLLLPEYVTTLLEFMEREENNRVGVVQTPYSAIPQATNMLERIAGATTDIQYIIHQGFTHFKATYWVGANALIRKKALEEIAAFATERGFTIKKYIQDRTVIEDTESTVDLIDKGWILYNYPERLAYSATPPDFGSLLIQRRRWANGGLIILPKLLRYLFLKPDKRKKLPEGLMRFHYLVSTFVVNFGLLVFLALPMKTSIPSLWLPLTALPYYFLYGRDLKRIGYKGSDLLRVYAFNLMLIPINLGGALKSLQQAVTGKKIPFGRTPKVGERTSAPFLYILLEYSLLFYCVFGLLIDLSRQHWTQAIISAINVVFFTYIITKYVGVKESLVDISNEIKARLHFLEV